MGVKRKVKKLFSQNLIKISASVNLDTLNLYAALVLLELESRESVEKVLERFKEYLRVVHVFLMLAGYNLAALVIAEDRALLKAGLWKSVL